MKNGRSQRDYLEAVDSLITDQYEWKSRSGTAPIIIAPNISIMGVTIYPNSLSPTVVAKKRCRTHIDQPSGVPSKKPSIQPRSLYKGKPTN